MTMNAARLLPPNSTPLERALLLTSPTDAWGEHADLAANIESRRPATFAPWLAAEWNLSQFAPYFEDAQQLIDAGLPWLMERGSASSVSRALSWVDLQGEIEEDGSLLHIQLSGATAPANLADMKHLVNASVPAHVQLYRLFHGYDMRHIVCDRSTLDNALLDGDSGARVDGVLLSFGEKRTGVVSYTPQDVELTTSAARFAFIPYDDRVLLDAWRLDSEVIVDGSLMIGQLITGIQTCSAQTPDTISARRTYSKAQMVLDEADFGALDDINSTLDGGSFVSVADPLRTDSNALDSHDVLRAVTYLDELLTDVRYALLAAPAIPDLSTTTLDVIHTGGADLPAISTRRSWTGTWDNDAWRLRIPLKLTHTGQ